MRTCQLAQNGSVVADAGTDLHNPITGLHFRTDEEPSPKPVVQTAHFVEEVRDLSGLAGERVML